MPRPAFRPFTLAMEDAGRALVQLGMSVEQAAVALAVMAPEGQEAAFGLGLEYLAWRSAHGLNPSPQFERLVSHFEEQVAMDGTIPSLWPFDAYLG